MVPIFKGKCDFRNCSCHRAVNEHGMEVVERVLDKNGGGGKGVRQKCFVE